MAPNDRGFFYCLFLENGAYSASVLKTPYEAASAPSAKRTFLYLYLLQIAPDMAEREANKRPARGICPPTSYGFERLAAISKMANSQKLRRSSLC